MVAIRTAAPACWPMASGRGLSIRSVRFTLIRDGGRRDGEHSAPGIGDAFCDGPSEGLPVAKYKGELDLLDLRVPCYVLTNGQRVIGRTSMTELLTGIKGGGGLEKYLDVGYLKPLISIDDILERMVPFRLPEVEGLERKVKGVGSSRVDLQACKLEYSIVSPK